MRALDTIQNIKTNACILQIQRTGEFSVTILDNTESLLFSNRMAFKDKASSSPLAIKKLNQAEMFACKLFPRINYLKLKF